MASTDAAFPGPQQRIHTNCTHITMSRFYGANVLCSFCGRPGPFGWIYLCTQDREDVLEHAVADVSPSILNATSRILAPKIGLRSRSPAARADQLSFFTENTAQQLTGYSPDQIELILKQREEVQSTIEEKKLRTLTTSSPDDETDPARPPWVPKLSKECTYTACPRCRPGYAARSFLSIDAVANGEVLPTSALGFGFHPIGERPVVDAEILKTIGIRVPDPSPSNTPIQHTFLCAEEFSTGEPEDPSKMQPVIRGDDGEGEEGEIHSCKESTGGDVSNTSRSPPPPPIVSRNLKHASTCSSIAGSP